MTVPSQSLVHPGSGLAILLPPSEGKAPGGHSPKWTAGSGLFGRQLGRQRRLIVDRLAELGGGDSKILGVSGAHLERARDVNTHLVGAPTLPAWQRYTGVVWDHLDPATLSPLARQQAQQSVVIFSGLLGLAGFDDSIPDYKLKMGTSLAEIGKVSTWWRSHLSTVLNSWLNDRIVIDLLPQEHRAAWQPVSSDKQSSNSRHIVVNFVNKSGRTVGHDAKAAKGLLVRHLLESKVKPEQALASWRHPQFSLELT